VIENICSARQIGARSRARTHAHTHTKTNSEIMIMEKVIIIVVISGFHNTETDRLRSVIVISPSEVVQTHFIFHREGSVGRGGGGVGVGEEIILILTLVRMLFCVTGGHKPYNRVFSCFIISPKFLLKKSFKFLYFMKNFLALSRLQCPSL
jgi:hypothetical protein